MQCRSSEASIEVVEIDAILWEFVEAKFISISILISLIILVVTDPGSRSGAVLGGWETCKRE